MWPKYTRPTPTIAATCTPATPSTAVSRRGRLIEFGRRHVRRQKHHMLALGEVGVILGNNGNVFLNNHPRTDPTNHKEPFKAAPPITPQQFTQIALLGNILNILGQEGL